jgi:hypothetical protein
VRAFAVATLAVVAACGAPAAPRQPEPPDLGFTSEAEVLADVQRRLIALGHGAAASATMTIEPELVLAYYRAGVIHMREVFADPAIIAGKLELLVRGIYGDRAEVFYATVGSRREAVQAFRELGVLAIAHELFHHVRLADVTAGPIEIYPEEDAAMQLEYAFLGELIAERIADDAWRDRYARLQRAFVAACPPAVVAALPASAADRHALFDAIADDSFAALTAITAGRPNPAPTPLLQRTALYALRRLELAAAPPRRLSDVAGELLATAPR